MTLLLVNTFLHPRGGDTTLFYDEWRGWEARGVEVVPFGMRHPDNEVSPWASHFPSWRSPREPRGLAERGAALFRSVWNREAAGALAALVRQVRPAAAHVHHLHRHLTPAIFPVLRAAGVRTAWTLHDHELVCPNGLRFTAGAPCFRCRGGHYAAAVHHRCKDGNTAASVAVALEKAAHRRLRGWAAPDVYVSPSRHLLDGLAADGLPEARCVHVPNLVQVAAEPGPLGRAVVFAGRLTAEKGVDVVAAFARRRPDVRVEVYGDGPERSRLSGLANVTLHGARPRAEVHAALATAAVALVPSRWPENQPYAVLEAQLLGRPVVARAVGGVPELVEDGVSGRLGATDAELVAAVEALLADPERAAAMGARARERVRTTHAPDAWFARMGGLLGVAG